MAKQRDIEMRLWKGGKNIKKNYNNKNNIIQRLAFIGSGGLFSSISGTTICNFSGRFNLFVLDNRFNLFGRLNNRFNLFGRLNFYCRILVFCLRTNISFNSFFINNLDISSFTILGSWFNTFVRLNI